MLNLTDIGKAILSGVLEGATEFVPISSTGHLILMDRWLSFEKLPHGTFEIAIQFGAILAVLVLYKDYFKSLLQSGKKQQSHFINLSLGTIPILIAGFLMYDTIKSLFTIECVAIGLSVGGILLVIAHFTQKKWPRKTQSIEEITPIQALSIGLFQCLALWPGMSRSGSTIIGGLFLGLAQKQAAEFSFILAVPAMAAATGYELLKTFHTLSSEGLILIGIGFITAFIVAYISIRFFLTILNKTGLLPFAIYRILISALILWS